VTGLADILKATVMPAPTVLGLRMEAFTVGHAILLHRMGSPFIVGGHADAHSLVEAVIVCSQSAIESVKTMGSRLGWFPLWLMRSRVKKANLLAECEKLKSWIEAQSDCPEILQKPGSKLKSPTMPWPERILVGLVSIGFDESTVINMPVVDAERFYLTNAELRGDVELWSDKQEALWRYAQEQHVGLRN